MTLLIFKQHKSRFFNERLNRLRNVKIKTNSQIGWLVVYFLVASNVLKHADTLENCFDKSAAKTDKTLLHNTQP